MRVISQNGSIDLPYENVGVGLSRLNEGGIVAYPLHMTSDSEIMTMAKYSTEDKARKALDMLHEAYLGLFLAKNIEVPEDFSEKIKEIIASGFGVVIINDNNKSASFEPLHTVWRFPQDDEL